MRETEPRSGVSILTTIFPDSGRVRTNIPRIMQRAVKWRPKKEHKPVGPSRLLNTLVELSHEKRVIKPVPAVVPAVASNGLNGLHILLVEDNALNQQVAGELLRDEGIIIDIASDGAAAIQFVKAIRYDLILMDIQMPVMDGFEAASHRPA